MPLDLASLYALAPACAPAIAPSTLLAIARVESGFDPLAIGVNGPHPHRLPVAGREDAVRAARSLIAAGQDIDLGLGQINARNLASLGLSVEAAFDPCRNLAASATVLQAGYARAAPAPGEEQSGLRTALSLYNTGDPQRGFRNGYVTKVTAAASRLVPAIANAPVASSAALVEPQVPPAWDVFGRARLAATQTSFVFSPIAGAPQ